MLCSHFIANSCLARIFFTTGIIYSLSQLLLLRCFGHHVSDTQALRLWQIYISSLNHVNVLLLLFMHFLHRWNWWTLDSLHHSDHTHTFYCITPHELGYNGDVCSQYKYVSFKVNFKMHNKIMQNICICMCQYTIWNGTCWIWGDFDGIWMSRVACSFKLFLFKSGDKIWNFSLWMIMWLDLLKVWEMC